MPVSTLLLNKEKVGSLVTNHNRTDISQPNVENNSLALDR